MQKKDLFTKILAIIGTALAWLPILAPILLSLTTIGRGHGYMIDYLMPAELFPVALAGGVILVWASIRARHHQRLIGWGLGIAVGLLVGGQALAMVTGVATGNKPQTIWFALIVASIAIYILALIAMGIGGVWLLRDLFRIFESS